MVERLTLLMAQIDLSPLPKASDNIIPNILSVLVTVIAAVCLLFIVIGGLRYILSEGDPQGVAKAKGTIVYALVGLVVVILAQAIVKFVINGVS